MIKATLKTSSNITLLLDFLHKNNLRIRGVLNHGVIWDAILNKASDNVYILCYKIYSTTSQTQFKNCEQFIKAYPEIATYLQHELFDLYSKEILSASYDNPGEGVIRNIFALPVHGARFLHVNEHLFKIEQH